MEASPVRQQLHGLAYNALLYLFKYISTMLPPVFVWRYPDKQFTTVRRKRHQMIFKMKSHHSNSILKTR